MLRPLRHRDYRLLWGGMSISMLGDGFFVVALAFQVYALSNDPGALALVWLAWAVAMGASVLAGGVLTDRADPRRIIIGADTARLLALVAFGFLSVSGALEVWHCAVLMAVYGVGMAFFQPAFMRLVPSLVDEDELVAANALDEFVRPFCMYFAGPALGGLVVATLGPATGFFVDAATFAIAIACVALLRTRTRTPTPAAAAAAGAAPPSMRRELLEGFRHVRATPWLWGTLLASAVAMLCFYGPVEVLLPYVVKTEYGGGADAFGIILAAGGAGSILAALVMGRRALPRRSLTVMYLMWGSAAAMIAGYGIVTSTPQAMIFAALYGAGLTVGMVIWRTLLQTNVPRALLGRVSSVDQFVSILLMPLSFALVGPVSQLVGARATLIGGGLLACTVALLVLVLLPEMRLVEGAVAAATAPEPSRSVPPPLPEPNALTRG